MKLDKVIAVRTSKTVYKEGDLAVKVFDENYSKADILNEALNLAKVEVTDLHTPGVKEVTVIDGKWSIVTDYADGKTLGRLMEESPDKEDEYLEMFVTVQLDIHSKTVPSLNKLKDKMERKINESGLDATTRYELQTRLESMPKHKKLCHGDFNPNNVVLKADGTAHILDWAHVTQGNAGADAARTYMLFKLDGKDELAEKYLSLFCEKADIAKQYVQKWLPIVAASQLVKGKENEKELLTTWVSVVEYE